MALDNESFNAELYDLLKVRGYKPVPLNSKNQRVGASQEADVIEFTFKKDGKKYGKAWASVDNANKVTIYYDEEQNDSPSQATPGVDYDDSWTGLLKHIKNWGQRRQLSFELANKDRLSDDMRQRDYYKMKAKIAESYHPMGKKASYNDAVPNVKIVIQHNRALEEGEQRFRNIAKIYLENVDGERFLAPTTRPGIARVYARHIAEGGLPNDERWGHIKSICEEYNKMAGFVRATRNKQFNESAQQLVNEGVNHYNKLRETLTKMTGHRGYNAYFESWTPTLMEEEGDTSINELFVQETVDPRIESVMPILSRLRKKVSEMSEVVALGEWADDIISEKLEIGEEEKETPKHGLADHPGRNTGVGLRTFSQTPEQDRCPKCNSLFKNHYKQGVAEGSKIPMVKDPETGRKHPDYGNTGMMRDLAAAAQKRKSQTRSEPTKSNPNDLSKYNDFPDTNKHPWMPVMIGEPSWENIPKSLEVWARRKGIHRDIDISHDPEGKIWTIKGKSGYPHDTEYTYRWKYDYDGNQFEPVEQGVAEGSGDKVICDYTGKPMHVTYVHDASGKVKLANDKGEAQPNYRNPENLKKIDEASKKAPWEKEGEWSKEQKRKGADYTIVKPKDSKKEEKVDESSEERPYVCVHAKKGKCEVTGKSSYEAAKKAAEKWKLKSTAGIDAHLKDVTHKTSEIGESKDDVEDEDESKKTKLYSIKVTTKDGSVKNYRVSAKHHSDAEKKARENHNKKFSDNPAKKVKAVGVYAKKAEVDEATDLKSIPQEGLNPQQQGVGQLGPTEKAKKISPVLGKEPKQHPFKGKLVGANESVENDELALITKMAGIKKSQN